MKLIHLTLCLALTFQPFCQSAYSFALTKSSNKAIANKGLQSLQQMRISWRHSPTLENFAKTAERNLHFAPTQSFLPLIARTNKNQLVNYTVFGNKITLESQGRSLTIETTANNTITINGQPLKEADFQDQKTLLMRINKLNELRPQSRSVSLFFYLFDSFVPTVHADLGWIGFSAIVIAAGIVAFGIHKATKNLSKTKHEVVVKTPKSITVNHKVDVNVPKIVTDSNVKVDVNGNLNATGTINGTGTLNGNLNADGLPNNIDINLNGLGVQ